MTRSVPGRAPTRLVWAWAWARTHLVWAWASAPTHLAWAWAWAMGPARARRMETRGPAYRVESTANPADPMCDNSASRCRTADRAEAGAAEPAAPSREPARRSCRSGAPARRHGKPAQVLSVPGRVPPVIIRRPRRAASRSGVPLWPPLTLPRSCGRRRSRHATLEHRIRTPQLFACSNIGTRLRRALVTRVREGSSTLWTDDYANGLGRPCFPASPRHGASDPSLPRRVTAFEPM